MGISNILSEVNYEKIFSEKFYDQEVIQNLELFIMLLLKNISIFVISRDFTFH